MGKIWNQSSLKEIEASETREREREHSDEELELCQLITRLKQNVASQSIECSERLLSYDN